MMNKLLIAAICLGVVSGKPRWHQLENYTFEQYLDDFNLNFHPSELEFRRNTFVTELTRVRAHNAKNLSWKEGINKYSVLTPKERAVFHGRSKGVAANQKSMLKGQNAVPEGLTQPVSALPKHVDWRSKGVVTAVKDQGHCGSCWAFASTATMESHIALQTGLLFDLSTEQVAMCAPNPDACGGTGKCEGSTAELAFEYVSSSPGLYEEYQYSYASYGGVDYECAYPATSTASPVATINGYVKLPNNDYSSVMNAIATVGPLAINVDASTWHAYESGIFNGCNQVNPDVNHVVVLMGYGEDETGKYWLVRNSWSPTWGEAGYIKLLRQDSQKEQVCGSDVTPQDGVECKGSDSPVEVCGTCGVIYDVSYPTNASIL